METIPAPEQQKQARKKNRTPIFAYILALALWGGLIFGAYYYATTYIDSSIRNVQETNALHMKGVEERLDIIQAELEVVKEALASTDQTLARTDSTREELNQRIEELDRQLEQLEESLNILRMSPDARR